MAVLIIGATGGIGSALAHRLVARGIGVHLTGRDEARLEALGASLSCPWTRADALIPDELERAVAEAGEPLSGVVYAAGSITLKPLGRTTDDDMLHDFRINALGAARSIRAAIPALRQAGNGSVVLFSSVAAGRGFPFHSSIAMAKGAVEALTRSLAAELAPKIRVNCIAPSLTRTGLTAKLVATEQAEASLARAHPLQRIGEAGDVAAMADYLLSEQAAWITGQVFPVDGGRSSLAGPN